FAASLENLVETPECLPSLHTWVNQYLRSFPHALLENSLLGTLSTDGVRVYAVDDLPIPPVVNTYPYYSRRQDQRINVRLAPELTDAVYHSRLLAFDVQSGKLA